jgi:hypothetical protein
MKNNEAKELVKATFWAARTTHREFQDHCEAIGISYWKGFTEAVKLWVAETQDRRVLTKK